MNKAISSSSPCKSEPRKTPMALTEELVARTMRAVEDAGPTPGMVYMTDADYARFRDEILASAPPGPPKLFAYGSLLSKPVGEVGGGERAVATGWHRSFCFTVKRFRGTVENPGLMMALDRRPVPGHGVRDRRAGGGQSRSAAAPRDDHPAGRQRAALAFQVRTEGGVASARLRQSIAPIRAWRRQARHSGRSRRRWRRPSAIGANSGAEWSLFGDHPPS